jgi:hypothetical protein
MELIDTLLGSIMHPGIGYWRQEHGFVAILRYAHICAITKCVLCFFMCLYVCRSVYIYFIRRASFFRYRSD